MSELQNKIGGGLNKIQGSLQQGKQKLQVAQEISQIQHSINTLRQKRQELIVKIGSKMHKNLRLKKVVVDSEFQEFSTDIELMDKEIYKLSLNMDELKFSSQDTYVCTSCESPVLPTDKFCGSCGTVVVIPETIEDVKKACQECEENIPNSAAFCPCCGHATVLE